jgi:hypothetical protein
LAALGSDLRRSTLTASPAEISIDEGKPKDHQQIKKLNKTTQSVQRERERESETQVPESCMDCITFLQKLFDKPRANIA